MFQYALYLQLKSLGREVRIDDVSGFVEDRQRVYALAPFGAAYERADEKELRRMLDSSPFLHAKIRRKLCGRKKKSYFEEDKRYRPQILDWDDIYLEGYWQTEKYFRTAARQVREMFDTDKLVTYITTRTSGGQALQEWLSKVAATESVSVHMRRGDYLLPVNRQLFGDICTEEYYEGASGEMKRKCPKAHFYLFSDDIPYVREKYKGEAYTVVDVNKGKDSFYDIWLMSRCKHNVCANSTFSFWGARLNRNKDKTIIRPSIHKNSQKFEPQRMHDLWKGWTLIDKTGKIV